MSVRILLTANLKRDNYRQAVEGCGGLATVEYLPDIDLSYDGLILCGGNDVDPSYYGQEINGAVEIDRLRDENEFALARGYIDAGKPVMGICRGYQLLNIFFGGTLHQHLSNSKEHRKIDGGDAVHSVKAEKGSLVEQFYGEEFVVNSFHHQAVDRLGDGLWATAVSEDGTVIEAFEHKELPVFGVQWHPERMCFANKRENTVDGTPVFKYFLELCEKAKKKANVRKMAEADIPVIAALEAQTFSDAWTSQSIYETFCQKQAFITVAEVEGEIAGYCIVYYAMEEGEIARIATAQTMRRQGIGRGLLDYTCECCKEKQVERLLLDVRESNIGARAFYQAYGFEEDGIRKNFYEQPKENAVLMSKVLS